MGLSTGSRIEFRGNLRHVKLIRSHANTNAVKIFKNPQDAFKAIDGNVKTVSEAKLVFFSDTHTSGVANLYNSALIGITINDGDIVLVEGVEKGKIIDPFQHIQTFHLPESVKFIVLGWDNIKLRDKAVVIVKQMIGIIRLIDLVPVDQRQILLDKFDELDKGLDRNIFARNISLVETIKEASKKTQGKIYVIAGGGHLTTLKKEEISGMPYIMLEPLDKTEDMTVEEYFGVKKSSSVKKWQYHKIK